MTNHYKTLGVSASIGKKELKKAYRKLASKYHPDRNKNVGAEDKLKEINEAYDVLNDDKRKAEYDAQRNYRSASTVDYNSTDAEFNDFFEKLRREAARSGAARRERQKPKTFITSITLEQAYSGTKIPSQFGEVTVPPGIRTGTRLFLQKDKVMVNITVDQHRKFKRANDDLLAEITVNSFEAILGTEATITHLDGKKYKFKLPEGIQQGHITKLSNKGMPNPELNTVGDLLIRVNIVTPTNLTQTEKDVIISINKVRNIDI